MIRNNRRSILTTMIAMFVAALVPTVLFGQKAEDARPPSGNNMKQMIIFGGVAEPLPNLPGALGQADFQFQSVMNIDGPAGGFATLSSVYAPEINSQIGIQSVERVATDVYLFRGTVKNSRQPDWVGRPVKVKVYICPSDNADVYLTIEDTPVQGLLLPAIQKVRDKVYG